MGGSNINTDRLKAFQRTNIRELSKDVDHVIPIKIVKNIGSEQGLVYVATSSPTSTSGWVCEPVMYQNPMHQLLIVNKQSFQRRYTIHGNKFV